VFVTCIDTICPQHVDRAVGCDSDTRLITAPRSRCTREAVNSHWRSLQLTTVIETREHDVGLFCVVIYPRNIKRAVSCGCNRWLSSIDALSRDLNGLWWQRLLTSRCQMIAACEHKQRRQENSNYFSHGFSF
jgi:hypothetical protein